ncbi:uncharacterized protein K02A2.6-like [Lucilia sericata]|uniref:uncharacterized protein K02A2.6-like n=1 Tax=Lucilia sericata TaxID=13632 RepID=UPI0018A86525|nr:uncharacterized protein K02A2.6-like [Lucilia sericata]
MRQLHRGHPGKERMKTLARSHVYWPGIDEDVAIFVRNCHNCAVAATAPVKHTLQSWPLATKPMERLHIDIAGPCNGQYYFVIIDAFSKWPEIYQVSNITSSTIIAKLTEMFARYGDCETIVSDNGTQFVSAQFNQFIKSRGITHIKTAPYHPQSNGQAERFVRTLKQALQKLKDEGNSHEILEIFLQTYRSTPRDNSKSPAELFLQRKIKTTLDLLKPQHSISSPQRNIKMEQQFNLKYGTIVEKVGNVNYNVYIYDNKTKLIRSHINQLKRRSENNNFSQPDSIQLMLELFGIKPNFINQSHIRPPVENSTPSTPLRLVEANVTASTPEQRQVEANSTPSSPENQLHSPLTFSTPIAAPPASISRPKRNVKPPERFGFTN